MRLKAQLTARSHVNDSKRGIQHEETRIDWSPHPKNRPQCEAFRSKADRLFYGGKAGGGKSDLILGLGLTAHHNAIVFRREYPQLKGLIKRSREIVQKLGRYNGTEKVWAGLPEGRTLEFGAIQYEKDKEKYQGRDHDLKAYDEITAFTRSQFEYTSGWNRTAKEGQRCRIVCTGNPPTGPSGAWVIEYWGAWLDPGNELYGLVKEGELVWYVVFNEVDIPIQIGGDRPELYIHTDESGKEHSLKPHSRTFISASLKDNPFIGDEYLSVLQALPKELQDSLLHGKFTLDFEDSPWQIIPSKWVELAFDRWRGAETRPTEQTGLGVDVARGGRDSTVLSKKFGWWFDELLEFPGSTTPDAQATATQIEIHAGAYTRVNVDVIGVGSGVVDLLKYDPRVFGFSSSYAATEFDSSDKIAFKNLRTQMLWLVREALDPENGKGWALPPSTKLKVDLCAARWEATSPTKEQAKLGAQYQIVAEEKAAIKKRIGRSPDYGDALCMAAWEGPKVTEIEITHGKIRVS